MIPDAEAAALEGGLHVWLDGGRRDSGDDLASWPCGWREAGSRRPWRWRRFDEGSSQIVFWKPDSVTMVGPFYRMWRRFFRAKAQRFDATGGDACGCRYSIGGVGVATFVAS